MTKKNQNSDVFAAVVKGVSTLWSGYKRSARQRHEGPLSTLFDDLLGLEMSDAKATKYLLKDVSEIVDAVKKKQTKKKFDEIIDNSF